VKKRDELVRLEEEHRKAEHDLDIKWAQDQVIITFTEVVKVDDPSPYHVRFDSE